MTTPEPPAKNRPSPVLVGMGSVIILLLMAGVGVGIAALVKQSGSVATARAAATTHRRAPSVTVVVPNTTATPACAPAALFAAAVQKEGFSPNDPSYAQLSQSGQPPGASEPICIGDWALATVSRPNVGTTDGETLFEASGHTWVEVNEVGAPFTACTLEGQGVPANVAEALMTTLGAPTTC